ncbi:MAG: orotate phosphoribosyltransferase [Crocinitomicaceae bacterium]|nr:orotate phosphoribosyltransferase [Crocinitomicaceae bacterium]
MITDIDRATKIAEFLLQIKAVKLAPKNPFTWSSGWKSPIYCDNRKTLSYPNIRTYIRQSYVEAILNAYGKPDVIAGVATGGIAQGALVAQELGLPFIYVRDKAKGHGMKNNIEGNYEKDQNVVVIEDLISTGGSSLKAVESLREAGMHVKGVIAIFSYGFQKAEELFQAANCPFEVLSNYDILIEKALDQGAISKHDVDSLRDWRIAPESWGK